MAVAPPPANTQQSTRLNVGLPTSSTAPSPEKFFSRDQQLRRNPATGAAIGSPTTIPKAAAFPQTGPGSRPVPQGIGTTGVGGQAGGGIGGAFGFQPGAVPGRDAIAFLSRTGMQLPQFLQALKTNEFIQPQNLQRASQELGGVNLPSLQGFNRLLPSQQKILAGFFETLLGIPFEDIFAAISQPFQGLSSARPGATRTGSTFR